MVETPEIQVAHLIVSKIWWHQVDLIAQLKHSKAGA